MQPHAAIGEHLAVQPVVAAVALGQQRGDLVGDRADARLQRRTGRDVVDGVPGDFLVDVGGLCVTSRQCQGRVCRAHQHVDLVDVQRVAMLFAEPERPRVGVGDLDDEQPFRVGARAVQFADRAACVQRQGAPTVGVGRRRDRRHHPRGLGLQQWTEATEVRGGELDVGTHVAQGPLERTVRSRTGNGRRTGEQFGADGEQRAGDAKIRPVLALAQGTQERRWLAGPERHSQRVFGVEPRGGLFGTQFLWHCAGSYIPRHLSRTLGQYSATC